MDDDARVAAEPPRGLGRDREVALDRARPARLGRRVGGPRPGPARHEQLGVDVHDDLVTVRGWPTADARHQDRVGHPHEGVGAQAGRRRLFTAARGAERFAGEVQRPLQDGGVLRGEPPADGDGAVVRGIEHEEPLVVGGLRLLAPDAPRRADHALQLRGRVHARELDERVLVLDRTQPGDRADLGVRELAPGERRLDHRHGRQAACDADVLTRSAGRDRAPPAEPMGTRLTAPLGPGPALVELRDQRQPPSHRRAEVGRQRRDLVRQPLVAERRLDRVSSRPVHEHMFAPTPDGNDGHEWRVRARGASAEAPPAPPTTASSR